MKLHNLNAASVKLCLIIFVTFLQFLSITAAASKENQTTLLKIDLENAFCGPHKINLREITIQQLQDAMKNGRLTSEQLVKCYVKRIRLMNPFLNATLEINPDAIQIARKLDQDRANGKSHSLLLGIPVLLKDVIATFDKMENTCGTVAMLGVKPNADAEVVKRLREAGAVILGKSNQAEYSKSLTPPNGWSGRGGRTNNAYVRKEDSSGSSSGSAVAVAANMVTVALGGETDGSIVSPAREASLVGLKPGINRVPTSGCILVTFTQDVMGPLARTVQDAAIVFNVIKNKVNVKNMVKIRNATELLNDPYRIGVLRVPNWAVATNSSMEEIPTLEKILRKLKEKANFVVIDPIQGNESHLDKVTRDSELIVFHHELKHNFNSYLKQDVLHPSQNKIKTLADIIAFNIAHPPKEGYDQNNFLDSEATDGLSNKTYIQNRDKNKAECRKYVDFMLTKYSLDAIVIPTTDDWTFIPAVCGYPHISVQAGFLKSGLPFSISFYSGLGSEEKLLAIAAKLESIHKARRTSKFLD